MITPAMMPAEYNFEILGRRENELTPRPEEVVRRMAEIQRSWSPRERAQRRAVGQMRLRALANSIGVSNVA